MRHPLSFFILLFSSAVVANSSVSSSPENNLKLPPQEQQRDTCAGKPLSKLARLLGWTPTPITPQNLCGGYYFEPASISAHPNPLPLSAMQMDITSKGPAVYRTNSNSTLEDDVTLLQPGRKIRADKAILIPNKETGQVDEIELQGNVQFQESGRLVVGKKSRINMAKDTLVVNQGAYHIVRPSDTGPMDSWGTAEEAHRVSPVFSWFKKATYTTCTPTDPSWYLKSSHLALDKETGRGVAKQVVLYAKNVPIFYTPYLSFPIDKNRYSGFLYPSFGYDSHSGAFIGIPYYFNLAPNYDDTLTLTPMSKRGLLGSNLFRYLTQRNAGTLQLDFLPDDRAFSAFKQETVEQYAPGPYNTPFLDVLNRSSNNRGSVAFHNDSLFNPHWSSSLDLHYVTDDYYFQDLASNLSDLTTDQLLNQAVLAYEGEHWQFSSRVQAWQTLHPINQNFVLDQYQRLPELSLSAYWPDLAHGLSYAFNSEFVYFNHADDFFTHLPYPTGSRFHFSPQVSLPLTSRAAFFTPTLALDMTGYSIHDNGVLNTSVSPATITPDSDPTLNQVRTLPVFNIDSGLYFDRHVTLGKNNYYQTLEPRAFYLFVPAENQDHIPVFDTTLPPFSFDDLYRTNRFIGYDRMGDANQFSLGVTSRLLDGYTGAEKINASIGAIYYLRKRTVCLYPDCHDAPALDNAISPIAAQLTYHINPVMSVVGNAAWDPNTSQMNNDSVGFRYSPSAKRIISLSYNYIKNGDVLDAADVNSSKNNLHRIDLAFTWPLSNSWNIVGDWNYNISHAYPQTYFYGLEYETCCWSARLVSSRVLQSEDMAGNTSFRSAYYLQFSFKGLGSVGDNGGSNLLTTSIPGYSDIFNR